MSLIWCDSFSGYGSSDLVGAGRYSANGGVFGSMAVGSGGRSGGGLVTTGTGDSAYLQKNFGVNHAKLILGMGFRLATQYPASSNQQVVVFYDGGSAQVSLLVTNSGYLQVTNGHGTLLGQSVAPISVGVWYWLEISVTFGNSGSFEVRLNGSTIISGSGVDTSLSGNSYATTFQIGSTYANGRNNQFSDLYVCNGLGSVNNNFLGDCKVSLLLPNGAGNSAQWTPSAGSNYQCVDETTHNGDTDYVSSSTVGNIDTYAFGNLAANAGTILGVVTQTLARKDDAGSVTIAPVIRTNSNNYEGSAVPVPTSYTYLRQIYEQNPDTAAAWSASEVNAAEFGFKKVS